MKYLGMYQGSNIPLFKSFEIDLGYKGVTIIRGMNKNAVGMRDRNNGSGKSLLLSGLAEILISSNPSIDRNETIARKALFPKPTSLLTLEMDKRTIAKGRFNGATVSYGIEADKGGLEKVKKDVATEYLLDKLGYNEDLFYTLVYLDGGKDFPLIVGTPTQRIQFLSNIFADIDMFADFYGYFSSKLKDFQEKLYRRETLQEELAELTDTDDQEELKVSDSDIEKLEKKLKSDSKELDMLHNAISNKEMYSTFKKLDRSIANLENELGIERSVAKKELVKEIECRRSKREYKRISTLVSDAKRNLSESKKRKQQLEDSDLDDSKYSLIDSDNEMADTYRSWANEVKTIINSLHKRFNINFRIKSPNSMEDFKRCHTLLDMIDFYVNDMGSLVSNQSDKSPTKIGQSIKSNELMVIANQVESARSKVNSLKKADVTISELGESLSREEIKRLKKAHKNVLELESVVEEVEDYQAEYNQHKKTLESMQDVEIRPIKEFDLLTSLVRDLDTLESLGFDDSKTVDDSSLVDMKSTADKLEKSILNNKQKLVSMKETKKFSEENKSVVESLQTKITSLEKYERAVPLVASMKKAFSNNGIRVQVLRSLTQRLASIMNANASLTFPEPMKFSFDITERTCNIDAIRNPGTKHEIVSDIRTLSRGERKSFSLLLLYSLLPMMDDNKRLNIVAMDEMTSNMDFPSKEKIFREYIPALREVVPHIILADTGNLEIDDAREFTVVKKGSESKLVDSLDAHRG